MKSPDDGPPTMVGEAMTRRVVSVSPATSVLSARRLLHSLGVRHLPVVDNGRLVGMLSDRDLAVGERWRQPPDTEAAVMWGRRPVRGIMSTPVRSARPDDDLLFAVKQMLDWKISALPVLDHGRLAGMITTTDCLATLLQMMRPDMSVPGEDTSR